jgi:hypothetical protein
VTNALSCLKAMAIGALCGAALYVLVVYLMTDRQLDAHTYETISSGLSGNDNDQWKGETLALCQGKNRVASDGVSDRISFCQKAPMSIASQKGQ